MNVFTLERRDSLTPPLFCVILFLLLGRGSFYFTRFIIRREVMEKTMVKLFTVMLAAFVLFSGVTPLDAGERERPSTFKDRLQQRSQKFNSTWLNAPRKKHTDSSPFDTAQKPSPRQANFRTRCAAFNTTWLNAPRKRHTDSSTTEQRQAAFKQRCSTFNATWLNAPRRQNTDSTPAIFQTAVSSRNVK